VTPGDDAGYVLDEAEVLFWGLCPRCQRHLPSQHPKKENP
jgi:hypothetical protein